MLPFLLPMWESDATARAAVEHSVASGLADVGRGVAMIGAEASVDASTRGPLSAYGASLGGAYARAFELSMSSGASAPEDSVSGELWTGGDWTLSPYTELSLEANGYLATDLGVRADDPLASRDPFLSGSRLQYTVGGGPGLSVMLSRRSRVHAVAAYEQEGALTADDPEAVGVDAHTATSSFRYGYELSAVDTVRPELAYEYTRFYHALLDVDLRRGPAHIHAGTARIVEGHAFSRTLTGIIGGGVTVATPLPVLASRDLIVAPVARIGVTHVGAWYEIEAGYRYEYTSLGPRIGYGQEHTALLEVSFRPAQGGRARDFVMTGVGRLSAGSAPVAADPPLREDPDEPPPSLEGEVSRYVAVAGVEMEFPLARGLLLLSGLDLQYVIGRRDPAPPGGEGTGALRMIWTVGVAGTISTDKRNTVRDDPAGGEDERGDADRP